MINAWVEERCEAIRLALRIPGFPSEGDLFRLIDWLGANAGLRHSPAGAAGCMHLVGGRKVVVVPQRLNGKPLTWRMAHETGHALLSVGMGSLLRQMADADPRVERLAAVWDAQDEKRAEDFVLAWFMPSRLVGQFDRDDELAEVAGVTEEMAGRRRRQLGGAVLDLQGKLPRWSAANQYHCVAAQAKRKAALYVVRFGSREPVFDFPAALKTLEDDARQVNADLVALTNEEFERKYEDFRVERAESRLVDLAELQAWARGTVAV
ncbi:MAG: hypothetical protein ACO1SX_13065 [Actinomycetota bacterium]